MHARAVNPLEFFVALGMAAFAAFVANAQPVRRVTVIMVDPELRPRWVVEMVAMLAEDHIFAGEPFPIDF